MKQLQLKVVQNAKNYYEKSSWIWRGDCSTPAGEERQSSY